MTSKAKVVTVIVFEVENLTQKHLSFPLLYLVTPVHKYWARLSREPCSLPLWSCIWFFKTTIGVFLCCFWAPVTAPSWLFSLETEHQGLINGNNIVLAVRKLVKDVRSCSNLPLSPSICILYSAFQCCSLTSEGNAWSRMKLRKGLLPMDLHKLFHRQEARKLLGSQATQNSSHSLPRNLSERSIS